MNRIFAKAASFLDAARKNEYSKNFAVLLSGNIVAQLIPLFIAPIVSRLYAIEDFALLALILGLSSLISIGATLQYESAIVLPEDEHEAASLLALSLVLIFITTALTFLIIPFGQLIGDLLQSDLLQSKVYLIPPLVLLMSIFRVFNFWMIRKKNFKTLSVRQIGQSSTQASSKVVLALVGYTDWGLLLGTMLGYITSTTVLIYQSFKNDLNLLRNSFKVSSLINTAIKYKKFPFYTLPHGYGDVLMKDGVIFIISAFYGAQVLGLYSFATSILKKPVNLIGTSLRSVFYKRAVELKNDNAKLWRFTKRNLFIQSISAIIIFSPIIFFGDKLFAFAFGFKWLVAGEYSQYMSFWIIFIFLMSPLSSLPIILDRQKHFLIIATSLNLLILMIVYFGARLGFDFTITLLTLSCVTTIYLIGIFVWLKYILKE